MQQIIISSNKLIIFCATFTIIIFSQFHYHPCTCQFDHRRILLTITEFWTVESSSDTSAFIFVTPARNTFGTYCLQNLIRCNFYSSWEHGRSQWLFSFISLPTIFTWIQLGWITYYTVSLHDCNSLTFISKALSVGRRLLSAGGVADFLRHQSS